MGLLHNPDIFLIDEPFVGLDPKGIKDFKDILKLLRDDGKTILISTHILSSVDKLNDRIIIMKKGKIIADGSKQELQDAIGAEEQMSLEDIFLKISE
ncbi:hypothetical protein [Clostridium sp. KNHs214]|nr:hypothetical protein [Clostridium sp. KNHs214]